MAQDQNQDQAQIQAELLAELSGVQIAAAGQRKTNVSAGKGVILKVTNVTLNRSGNKGRRQLTAVCEVIAHPECSEDVGSTFFKNWGLETESNFKWLNTDLANLEIQPPVNGADMPRVMQNLMGVQFECTLVENAGYAPNCYINEGARIHTVNPSGMGSAASPF